MIGGNARHAGKTTLACGIIGKFSGQAIIGMKVTNIKPGYPGFHGDHTGEPEATWFIYEETDFSGDKDTSIMLRAGAQKVFYIRTSAEYMNEAFQEFNTLIDPSSFIICESRSLRQLVKPGIYILMIRDTDDHSEKDMTSYIGFADAICKRGNEPETVKNFIERITIKGHGWALENAK
jgi:hypothetical protein